MTEPWAPQQQGERTVRRRVRVSEPAGLHARPAARFAEAAARYSADVTVARYDDAEESGAAASAGTVPAHSVLSLMTLHIRAGEDILLTAHGEDAEEALRTLTRIAAPDADETTET